MTIGAIKSEHSSFCGKREEGIFVEIMLEFTDKGIFCSQANIYIDPWKPVQNALITHGHSDHARKGNGRYFCHQDTKSILQLRLGADIEVQGIHYSQPFTRNSVTISLHPAGHILGSAQVRLEHKGEIWVVSGDYKLNPDGLSMPFEPVKCHHFITESTFGLPVYKFPPTEEIFQNINSWWRENASDGFNTIIMAYALGKSQSILHHLDKSIGEIYLHGAVANVNESLKATGYTFPGKRIPAGQGKNSLRGALIIAPISALSSPWINKFSPSRKAVCSGWMQLRGTRRRYGVDRGFILSDHGDWDQLNKAVLATGAENIYVTHGYQSTFSKWLNESYRLKAVEIQTSFDPSVGDIE